MSSVLRSGLRSLFPAQFNRSKSSCGDLSSDLGMSGKLVVGQGLLEVFHSLLLERGEL